MTTTLDYARPTSPRHAPLVARVAAALLLYPAFLAAAIYGPWFIAWFILGHPPQPLRDDPDYPGAGALRGLSALALLGALPAGCAALALNVLHLAMIWPASTSKRIAVRLVLLVVPWLMLLALFYWDPGYAFTWWFD